MSWTKLVLLVLSLGVYLFGVESNRLIREHYEGFGPWFLRAAISMATFIPVYEVAMISNSFHFGWTF